jgi:hypothetical protein
MMTPEEALVELLIGLGELKDAIAFGRYSSDVLCGAINVIEARLEADGDIRRALLRSKAEPKVLAEGWWRGTGKHREFRLIKPPSTVGWKFIYLVAAPEREEV